MIVYVLTPGGNKSMGDRQDLLNLKPRDLTFVRPSMDLEHCSDQLSEVGGLFVSCQDATNCAGLPLWPSNSFPILTECLNLDMPILATGCGIYFLNEYFGGKKPVVCSHSLRSTDEKLENRQIYLSPGSKSAATVGSGGFFRVRSKHMIGLYENQRAPRLLASAYSVEEGLVEGLESTEHSWVLGFQANIEICTEAPRTFNNVLMAFFERVHNFSVTESA